MYLLTFITSLYIIKVHKYVKGTVELQDKLDIWPHQVSGFPSNPDIR